MYGRVVVVLLCDRRHDLEVSYVSVYMCGLFVQLFVVFVFVFFFFFQAEDGIRDHCVTGVQTCALPICLSAMFMLAVGRL